MYTHLQIDGDREKARDISGCMHFFRPSVIANVALPMLESNLCIYVHDTIMGKIVIYIVYNVYNNYKM